MGRLPANLDSRSLGVGPKILSVRVSVDFEGRWLRLHRGLHASILGYDTILRQCEVRRIRVSADI